MPRNPTGRPPGEHLAVLARLVRQTDANVAMSERRRRTIKKHLTMAMEELQKELRAKTPAGP